MIWLEVPQCEALFRDVQAQVPEPLVVVLNLGRIGHEHPLMTLLALVLFAFASGTASAVLSRRAGRAAARWYFAGVLILELLLLVGVTLLAYLPLMGMMSRVAGPA